MGSPKEDKKFQVLAENVDAATDQVMKASLSGDPVKVKAVLLYWFGSMYDEGMVRVCQVEQQVILLQQMIERLKASR